ncbi:hypothetical protein cypCar_00000448 [Cyprinus carpio]|nr:hypothetical protein cypCar_00000448 [Cyprinus carpio]
MSGCEVDAITTDCLALREQVTIYEEQLATMERQHETFEFRASSTAAIDAAGKEKEEQLAKLTGGKVKDVSKETDVNVLKNLIAELQKEVAELEKHGDELEAEIEGRKAKYLEEIEKLENYICQLEEEEADLQFQMKDQSGDYEELLNQKMNLDIEIAAFR